MLVYSESFLLRTAIDYDMEVYEVECIVRESKDDKEMYEKLEEFILNRRNK